MKEIVVGFLTGILGALFGLGGGFILVPILNMIGYDIKVSIGTSSASIVFTALSASIAYHKHRLIRYKEGLTLAAFSVVGAYIGAWITDMVSTALLKLIFGVIMTLAALRMMKKKEVPKEGKVNLLLITSGGFGAGILSGLLGIGGGIINVPLFSYIGLTIHEAVATSSFSIIFTASSGALKHFLLGNVNLMALILLVPGLIAGAQIGALIAKRMKAKRLRWLFSLVVLALAIRMIIKSGYF